MAKTKTLFECLRPVVSSAVEHTPEDLVNEYLESIVRDNPETFLRYMDESDILLRATLGPPPEVPE